MGFSLTQPLILSLVGLSLFEPFTQATAIAGRESYANASISANLEASSTCFPFGSARFSGMSPPAMGRKEWWCGKDETYGFLGLGYALEIRDCHHKSNSFEKINEDFKNMKNKFGAHFVRVYAPECGDQTIWRNLLKAGIANNMGVLPLVWWGFGDPNLWKKTKASILAVLADNELGPMAPYVFHSIAFGSEPITDGVDGNNFVKDFRDFNERLKPSGIPLTISEDVTKLNSPTWKQILPMTEVLHVHLMPYYRPWEFPDAEASWPFIEKWTRSLSKSYPDKVIMITETQWASKVGGTHDRGGGNPGVDLNNYKTFWLNYARNCNLFKEHKVGWFLHVYSDESGEKYFGMLDENGKPKMEFHPWRC